MFYLLIYLFFKWEYIIISQVHETLQLLTVTLITYRLIACVAVYSLCWDNIQKMSVARHQGWTANTMMIWAMAFSFVHRVPYNGAIHEEHPLEKPTSLNHECYLPNEHDFDKLKLRMAHMVSRIVCTYLPHFRNHYRDCVEWNIKHDHSEESTKKSTLVCILSFLLIICVYICFHRV